MRNYSLITIIFFVASIIATELFFRPKSNPGIKAESLIIFPENFQNSFHEAQPVTQAVEKTLQSDFTQHCHYKLRDGRTLDVFTSAQSDISTVNITADIFKHTPDRCWVGSGWFKIPSDNEKQTIQVGGDYLTFPSSVDLLRWKVLMRCC